MMRADQERSRPRVMAIIVAALHGMTRTNIHTTTSAVISRMKRVSD